MCSNFDNVVHGAGERLLAVLIQKPGGPCPAQEVCLFSTAGDCLRNIQPTEVDRIDLPQIEGFGVGTALTPPGHNFTQWQQVLSAPWEEGGTSSGKGPIP